MFSLSPFSVISVHWCVKMRKKTGYGTTARTAIFPTTTTRASWMDFEYLFQVLQHLMDLTPIIYPLAPNFFQEVTWTYWSTTMIEASTRRLKCGSFERFFLSKGSVISDCQSISYNSRTSIPTLNRNYCFCGSQKWKYFFFISKPKW